MSQPLSLSHTLTDYGFLYQYRIAKSHMRSDKDWLAVVEFLGRFGFKPTQTNNFTTRIFETNMWAAQAQIDSAILGFMTPLKEIGVELMLRFG